MFLHVYGILQKKEKPYSQMQAVCVCDRARVCPI
jgi:hypothetical protein